MILGAILVIKAEIPKAHELEARRGLALLFGLVVRRGDVAHAAQRFAHRGLPDGVGLDPGRDGHFAQGNAAVRQPALDRTAAQGRGDSGQFRHGDHLAASGQERVDLVVARVADQGDVVVVADAVAAAGPLDEFEEQLVGAALEEEKEVNVTFPEDYQAEELAGKVAVFKCTIHKIEAKELPALDDDFAKDVSEFDTLDEYKKEIKDNLTKKKEEQAKTEKENAVVDKAVENATMEIPEAMIDTQVENMVDDFARRIQSQGLSMEQYMQFTGATVDSLKEQMKPQAVKRIESRLVLEKVAEAENIQISDEKLDEELAKMAEMYKMELDKFKELVGEYEKEQMKKDLAVQEAVTLMADSAKEA